MGVQAPLGDQRTGDDGEGDHAKGQEQETMLDEQGESAGDKDQDRECQRSGAFPLPWRRSLAVEQAVERADQGAHPHHRMTNCARDALRVTEHGLEQKRQQCQ